MVHLHHHLFPMEIPLAQYKNDLLYLTLNVSYRQEV